MVFALAVAVSAVAVVPLSGTVAASGGDLEDFSGSEADWFLDGKDATFDDGSLVLTRANPNREGLGVYNESLRHDERYLGEFTYVAEHDKNKGGTAQGEGLLFFAVDGSAVDGDDLADYRVTRGAESDLGYYVENFPDAYLAVGFDRSGPFSTHWYDEDEPNEPYPHSVTIRGDDEVRPEADLGEGPEAIYEFVERTRVRDTYGERVDTNGDGVEEIDVRVVVEPDDGSSLVTVEMRWHDEWVRVHDRVVYDSTPPEELKFGIAAATGPEGQEAGYNVHRVETLELTEGHTIDGDVALAEAPLEEPLEVEVEATDGTDTWNDTVHLEAGETTASYRIDGLPSGTYDVSASVVGTDGEYVVEEDGYEVSTATGALIEDVDFTVVEGDDVFLEVGPLHAPANVTAGDPVEVDATVTNTGDRNGTQTVELRDFDGAVVDSGTVTLPGGESETLTLTWTTDDGDVGEGTLTVASENDTATTDTVTVEEPAPSFSVAIVDHSDVATEGEPIDLDVTVTNDGSASGTQDVTLADFDGVQVDSSSTTLEPGESENLTLTWLTEAGDAGEGTLTVASENDSATTDTVVVEPASDGDDSTTDGSGDTGSDDTDDSGDTDGSGDTDEPGDTGDSGGTSGGDVADDSDGADDGGETGGTGSDGTDGSDDSSDAAGEGDEGDTGADDETDGGDGTDGADEAEDGDSALEVVDSSLSDTRVWIDEPVTVTVVVENTGDEPAERTLELEVDGDVERSETVSLEPGERETVTMTLSFPSAGEYTVGVADQVVGTVAVDPTREAGSLDPGPVLFLVGALLLLLLAAARWLPGPEEGPGSPDQ